MAVAGHCDEQRPHSVQLNMSRTCFQSKWSTCELPKRVAFSRSCLESWPIGSSLRKKTLGSDVMMWKCFERGSRFRKTRTTRLWTHQATLLVPAATPGPAAARRGATRLEIGSHAPSRATSGSVAWTTSRPPS